MKTNKLNYLILSALITLGAQNVMASAAATVDEETTTEHPGHQGRPGQKVRVSMFYNGEGKAPGHQSLTGFNVTLPGGVVVYVRNEGIGGGEEGKRLSVVEEFDVSGLRSFPVTITYLSNFMEADNTTTPWQGLSDVECKGTQPDNMSKVVGVRILWDTKGECSLRHKHMTSMVKSAAKR